MSTLNLHARQLMTTFKALWYVKSEFYIPTQKFIYLARFITVWIETQDINLYINFGLSVILNLSVVASAMICQKKVKYS